MSDESLEPRVNSDSDKNENIAGGETTLDGAAATDAASRRAKDRVSIGPYILLEKLGEGGMGQVWLAEQTAPVKRKVALKLIRGGLYDNTVIQRFEAERQSLAVMNHPCVAKVFDAGSTADGQPYFVMEYVDGPPITRYCDMKKLKIRERLELFIQVCDGVQHAHQKAIIHRDLKPSNVLVVEVDGRPVPRIIDFGIAKAISSQPGTDETMFTKFGALVGTPGFMSPEQADPSVLDVDTRTDVYSLGVILYMLLTGTLPFDPDQWKKKPLDQVLRQLREEDPPSPSAKLSTEKATAAAAADGRSAEPRQLVRLLRGDLDWITLKAIQNDRTQRYGTPTELAADLTRYLENRPVTARPANTAYRLQKYVRRHRVAVSVAAGLVLLLTGFAAVQAVQLRRITRERDRANRITDFMTGMFKVSDPSQARGNTITAREILDRASTDINSNLTKDPELQAKMMFVMGNVYYDLGLYSRAESLLQQAKDTQQRVLGLKNPDTLNTMYVLAWTLQQEGRYPESEKLGRKVLDLQLRVLGPQHPDTLSTMRQLAWTLQREGKYAESEKLGREALDIQRRVLGPEHASTIGTMSNLAWTLQREGRYVESEKLAREALDLQLRVFGPDHPNTLIIINTLAVTLSHEGRYAETEKLFRDLLDTQTRVLGPEHPNTATTRYNLGCLAALQGRTDEAFSLIGEAIDHGLRASTDLGIDKDPDLASLHGDPRFAALVAHAKERAAAQHPK